MRINIDRTRCQGHFRCVDLAEDIFGEDDDGHAVAREDGRVPSEREMTVHEAIASCPEQAIEWLT
jgi:ferredoxin